MPLLSIIYVNYNTSKVLVDSLHSVYQALSDLDHEVIIVDNASPDPLVVADVAEAHPGSRVITSGTNLGFGRGNNLGAAEATGEYLWILNTDTLVPADHRLSDLLAFLERSPTHGAALPLVLDVNGSPEHHQVVRLPTPTRLVADKIPGGRLLGPVGRALASAYEDTTDRDVEVATAAALVIRRSAFEAVAGFSDEFFVYFEDTDLCRKLGAAGHLIRHHTTSRVVHLRGASIQSDDRRKHLYYDSLTLYADKWYGPTGRAAAKLMVAGMRSRLSPRTASHA